MTSSSPVARSMRWRAAIRSLPAALVIIGTPAWRPASTRLPCCSAGPVREKPLPFADQSAEGFSATVSFAISPVQANGTWMVVVASGVPGALGSGEFCNSAR